MPDRLSPRLLKELARLAGASQPDSLPRLEDQLEMVLRVLDSSDPQIRPVNSAGKPGGLVFLDRDIPLIVLPDLHARRDFLLDLLTTPFGRISVLEALEEGRVQVLCVGDGFHAEKRAVRRWQAALVEYGGGYKKHRQMDREMAESLGLMQMVMLLLSAFPRNFSFLKGNHENILNEEGRGNHPFGKFVYEGEMVRAWVERFLGEEFLYRYAEFEHRLPFMALAENLIISHAEPREVYTPEEVIDIEFDDELKLGLTWTANDQSREGAVAETLELYSACFRRPFSRYLGGHRTIQDLYRLRADGLYIQIHNPDRRVILYTDQREEIDPEVNIRDLDSIRSLPI